MLRDTLCLEIQLLAGIGGVPLKQVVVKSVLRALYIVLQTVDIV